jgi:DNA-binding MarR family transcriptional regulator
MRSKFGEPGVRVPTRSKHRLVFLLNVAQRRLQRFVAARSGDSGVTAAQSGMLFVLGQRDGALMSEAAAALDLNPPGISGLVDRMTVANLIKRRADPDDGRAWRLWLTPAGRDALAQTKVELTRINERLGEGFSDAEIDVVARWLASFQSKFPKGDDP